MDACDVSTLYQEVICCIMAQMAISRYQMYVSGRQHAAEISISFFRNQSEAELLQQRATPFVRQSW